MEQDFGHLSCLGFDPAVLFLLSALGKGGYNLFKVSISTLQIGKHCPSLLRKRERKGRPKLREEIRTRETKVTLTVFLKIRRPVATRKKSFLIHQLGEPVERFLIT